MMKISAGIVLIKTHPKRILLCHPTNAGWNKTLQFPKGELNGVEKHINAAIRETFEEVGLRIPQSDIHPGGSINYTNAKGMVYKIVYYYFANVDSMNLPDELPKWQLQAEEVDYAKFFTIQEAEKVIFHRFLPILKQIT